MIYSNSSFYDKNTDSLYSSVSYNINSPNVPIDGKVFIDKAMSITLPMGCLEALCNYLYSDYTYWENIAQEQVLVHPSEIENNSIVIIPNFNYATKSTKQKNTSVSNTLNNGVRGV